MNIITKNLIKLRKEHNLTQETLAKKLGISRPSYIQIEKGNRELSLSEAQRLSSFYNLEISDLYKKLERPEIIITKDDSSQKKESGLRVSVPQKKIEKFKQILLYILNKVGAKPNIGQTVLYKILYFIDFDYYELFEEQLIGATYIKNHHGPTPIEFQKIIQQMERQGQLETVKSKYFNYDQTKYLPKTEPDLKFISGRELNFIDNELTRLSNKSAKELSQYSHKDVPWITTEKQKPIKYEAVFYRTKETSVRDYDNENKV